MFPIRKGLKQGDIRRVQVHQDGLKLNGTHQLLVYADEVNILGGSVDTLKKNAEASAKLHVLGNAILDTNLVLI